MTDILCNWLNSDVKLSKKIDQNKFAKEFATGYLLGELLNNYKLQNDFPSFSQSKTTNSKLNNFTRLEPTLHLLEVPFDTVVARNIMTEKPGVATTLLYQLFIALNKKEKNNLTGVAMETMRANAPVVKESHERGIYTKRLKEMTPRQTALDLENLKKKYLARRDQHVEVEFRTRFEEEEQMREDQANRRQEELERRRQARQRQTEMLERIRAARVIIPKPPPNKTLEGLALQKELGRRKEAKDSYNNIAEFERKIKSVVPPTGDDSEIDVKKYMEESSRPLPQPNEFVDPVQNDEYIGKIRRQLQESSMAREEREKRRRKVLVDQMKAHKSQEDESREEVLVNRLMRQSQQERRIAVQLLQSRREKDVIIQNRVFREKQYEERRQKDFMESLNKEAELARLAKLDYIEQTKKDRELHDQIVQQRSEAKYRKHYHICKDILSQMVDFATKVGEYRELTENNLPSKLMREWTLLFTSGQPLYGPVEANQEVVEQEPELTEEEQKLEEEKQKLLNEGDFLEYKNMVGEWQPPEDCEVKEAAKPNPILGHIIKRIFNIVYPPSPPPEAPEYAPFPIKACFLGKTFSGKTSTLNRMAEERGLVVLNVDRLVAEAIDAYKGGEVLQLPPPKVESKPTGEGEAAAALDPKALPDAVGTADPSTTAAATSTAAEPPTGDASVEKPPLASDSKETLKPEQEEKAETESKSSKKSSKKPPPPPEEPKPELSDRAKLGQKASKFLKKGQPVKEDILVDLMVSAIRAIPEGRGWVMDGFPANLNQAKLLEKALTGYDADAKPSKIQEKKKTRLAIDPHPPKAPPLPVSGIDLVVLMDIDDNTILKRAAGRTYAPQKEEQFHQEFKPPPEGSVTGVGKQEKVVSVKDAAHEQEQIQQRLTGFQDSWKKLEKWYTGFGILTQIKADKSPEELYELATGSIDDYVSEREETAKMEEERKRLEEVARLKAEAEAAEALLAASLEKSTAGPDSTAPTGADSQQELSDKEGGKKRSRSNSPKSRKGGSPKGKRGDSPKSKRGDSPKAKRGDSSSPKRGDSKASSKREAKSGKSKGSTSPKRGKSGKKSKSPEPEPEPEIPEEPVGPPPPKPGSEEWVYVDQPLAAQLAEILAPLWQNVEKTYIDSSKETFCSIRGERESICRYFFQVKKEFVEFLKRPDIKQEFVDAWQKEFNEISDDIRDDEETKAELHQRVIDFRDRLWDICDNRKVEAEEERGRVMNEGWLEDRLGLLTNQYITLMQSEIDRYQDTLRLLHDYYNGMEGKIPDELSSTFARLPLIELPPTGVEGAPTDESIAAGSELGSAAPTPAPTPSQSATAHPATASSSKTGGGGGKKGSKDVTEAGDETAKLESSGEVAGLELDGEDKKKIRIPLVPRRPTSGRGFFPSQTPAGDKGGATSEKGGPKSRAGKKEGKEKPSATAVAEETAESPLPTVDPDEKLLNDAHLFSLMKVGELAAAELAAKESEEEADKQKEDEKAKDKEKEKSGKKGDKKGAKSGGGKKSSSPKSPAKKKKGAPSPTPVPTPLPDKTPEEKEKQELKDKMKQEYFASIGEEEAAVKTRLELIKVHGIQVLQDLKSQGNASFTSMMDWLGARFQAEMTSIDQMCSVTHHSIEEHCKLKQKLVIFQDKFLMDDDMQMYDSPTLPPRPSPVEPILPEVFTIDQIHRLLAHFQKCAPTGFISSKGFIDIFLDLTALTHGMEALPDMWMQITPYQLEQVVQMLSPDSEYIDSRTFLLQAAQPWPQPTQADLLETLARFKAVDSLGIGKVTREQFREVDLWFAPEPRPSTPDDPTETFPFDRTTRILRLFFDIFADFTTDPPMLDYINMLLYFSVDPDYQVGFFRALSVASGTHMPRLKKEETSDRLNDFEQQENPEKLQVMKEVVENILGHDLSIGTPAEVPPPELPLEEIPENAKNALVPLDALVRVLWHGQPTLGDSHRFSVTSDPENTFSRDRLANVYHDLGSENLESVSFYTLMQHPIIQDCLAMCHRYKSPDLKFAFISGPGAGTSDMDAQSLKPAVD